jgi:phosphoglycerate dehydrogenase-like enzyme
VLGREPRAGFRLCNSRGAYSVAVAEHCIAMMMALARGIHLHARDQRSHTWEYRPPYAQITGARACVIGVGSIGTEVARRCVGLGMRVSGVDILEMEPPAGVDVMYRASDVRRALPEADHVIAVIPGGEANYQLFNRDLFAAMKPGAFFFNGGRGAVVDEAALVEALHSGHLAGAGLDVFNEEPLPADSPLWDMENVLITPHMAGTSVMWDTNLVAVLVANLTNYHDGKPLVTQVIP